MRNEEYEIDKDAIRINADRRKDLIVLAKLRLSKGTYYNCLKNIFGMYCLHCNDLEEEDGKKRITRFGNYLALKKCDIDSQIRSFVKRRAEFLEIGHNPYTFWDSTLIKNLRITEDEQEHLESLREKNKPKANEQVDDINKLIKRNITKYDDSLDDIDEDEIQDIEEEECPFTEEEIDESNIMYNFDPSEFFE